jgi:methylmalonyl-CoA epimerase
MTNERHVTQLDVASLLAGGAKGGLVESEGSLDVGAVRRQATELGARVADLRGVDSKQALLEKLSRDLDLPEYFGHNWDALDEALRAPEPAQRVPLLILWPRPDALDDTDPQVVATLSAIVAEAAAARRSAGVAPLVLVRGSSMSETEQEFGLPFGAPTRVHHVAIVVRDMDAALATYRDQLRLPLDVLLPIESDGVRIAFLPVGESNIELVEPTDSSTGVARFLESRGEGFHHVCLEVDDIERELDRLAEAGVELIDKAARRGAEGPVAFIHPRSCHGVLVELIEATGGPAWTALGYDTEEAQSS